MQIMHIAYYCNIFNNSDDSDIKYYDDVFSSQHSSSNDEFTNSDLTLKNSNLFSV